MRLVPKSERGAALLTVLLLVAVMAALAATALERLRLSMALAGNSAALDQARAYAVGVESLMTLTIDDLIARSPERTTLAGGWNGQSRRIPMPGGGIVTAAVRDGGNCFNLNSVVEGRLPGALTPRLVGVRQFEDLMRVLEVPQDQARRIAEAAGDWADSDTDRAPSGAEDPNYGGGTAQYRTGNTLFAEVSEARTLAGMTPEIYGRLKPWLCALPAADLSPININTLTVEQAPLLSMLSPGQIPIETARQVIATRPAAGWASLSDFYRTRELIALILPLDVQLQPQLRTRWFRADLDVALQGAELHETALVDARVAPARVVARRWGSDD
jgi:general secretion pathway protein K